MWLHLVGVLPKLYRTHTYTCVHHSIAICIYTHARITLILNDSINLLVCVYSHKVMSYMVLDYICRHSNKIVLWNTFELKFDWSWVRYMVCDWASENVSSWHKTYVSTHKMSNIFFLYKVFYTFYKLQYLAYYIVRYWLLFYLNSFNGSFVMVK